MARQRIEIGPEGDARLRALTIAGGTAESIASILNADGFAVSRATVSRRMREMRGPVRPRRRAVMTMIVTTAADVDSSPESVPLTVPRSPVAWGRCASFRWCRCQTEVGVCERGPRIEIVVTPPEKEEPPAAPMAALLAEWWKGWRGSWGRLKPATWPPVEVMAPTAPCVTMIVAHDTSGRKPEAATANPTRPKRAPRVKTNVAPELVAVAAVQSGEVSSTAAAAIEGARAAQRALAAPLTHLRSGAGASFNAAPTVAVGAAVVPVAASRKPLTLAGHRCLKCGAPRGAHDPDLRCPSGSNITGLFRASSRSL